ncbi:MAG: glycine cleavage system aminomethyltransferase GcvT [Deltaproteobacteria bacterium]|nr:glycine cleavage system aminomethyltransferase GcvT [Deltaproteobacteria bacterium]
MENAPLKRTPLYDSHIARGARIVEFAGFQMPVVYTEVRDEHRAVRTGCGIFDVSHMGEFELTGDRSRTALQTLVPSDIDRLEPGRALYTVLLRPEGGIVDDLIIMQRAKDDYLITVNASNIAKDFDWMRSRLPADLHFVDRSASTALIAVQGPRAVDVLTPLTDRPVAALRTMSFLKGVRVAGRPALVSRSGYTGEDGFELYVDNGDATHIWSTLLAAGATPTGLGARDTLRLEARLPLYGNDLSDTTSPLEAGLGWIVHWTKGDFIGRASLEAQRANGVLRRLVGFKMIEPSIPRHGHRVFAPGADETPIGEVTSGTHSPTLEIGIGLAYVPPGFWEPGSAFEVEVRKQRRRAEVVKTPFYRRKA